VSTQRLNRLLLRSGLRYLLWHRWQALLALVGITLGVAVVLAVDLANNAASRSFKDAAAELRGATTHRLINPAGTVPQGLYAKLYTTPGHPPMAPVISDRVRVEGQAGRFRLVGLDLFAEGAFRPTLGESIRGESSLGSWLARPGAVALSAAAAATLGVESGAHIGITYEGRAYELQVAAVHPSNSSASADLLIVDIATAQAITGISDGLSYIDLVLDGEDETHKSWIETRIAEPIQLIDAGEQTEGVAGMSAAFELNLTAMSLLALLVGMFLIFNAMSFAIVQRRTLLGRLRALGVTATELSRLVFAEALVLAVIGTALGIVAGIVLGRGLTGIVASAVSSLYYDVAVASMPIEPLSLLKAALLGIAGTLAATWLPARQAAATPPLTTLSRSALESETRRLLPGAGLFGVALILIGLGVALVIPGGVVTGFAGLFMLLLGAALVTPMSLQLAHALLGRLKLSGTMRMAIRDLNRHLSRLATATAALMVALAASVGVAVMVESMRGSVQVWLDSMLSADLYVTADSFEDGAPLPRAVDALASQISGVTAVSRYRGNKVTLAGAPVPVIAADLAARSRSGFRFVATATPDPWVGVDQGQVLISEPLANRLDLDAGGRITLPTPEGHRAFGIAGVFQDYASEHGRIFIALPTYRALWSDASIDTIALFTDDADNAGDALRRAAIAALSADHELAFTPAREIYAESMRVFDRTFQITEVLRYLSLLVAFIGVFSALMAIQLERRREYAVLRAIGFTGGQITRLIIIQSLLLGLLAGLMAIPTGLAMAWVLTDAIQLRAFGWSMQYVVPPGPLLTSLLLGTLAAVLAGLYPAWRSGRQHPAAQLRED